MVRIDAPERVRAHHVDLMLVQDRGNAEFAVERPRDGRRVRYPCVGRALRVARGLADLPIGPHLRRGTSRRASPRPGALTRINGQPAVTAEILGIGRRRRASASRAPSTIRPRSRSCTDTPTMSTRVADPSVGRQPGVVSALYGGLLAVVALLASCAACASPRGRARHPAVDPDDLVEMYPRRFLQPRELIARRWAGMLVTLASVAEAITGSGRPTRTRPGAGRGEAAKAIVGQSTTGGSAAAHAGRRAVRLSWASRRWCDAGRPLVVALGFVPLAVSRPGVDAPGSADPDPRHRRLR